MISQDPAPNTAPSKPGRSLASVGGPFVGLLVGVLCTLGLLSATGRLRREEPSRETMIHDMGGEVMPFSLEKTEHVFEMTTTGGVQQVVVRESADSAQIPLIRQHLRHEAMLFGSGDFRDPRALHGADMPGLTELAAGASRLRVTYADVPGGGQITFSAPDVDLVTAVHRWFGAQLSDHGSDATYR